MIRFLRQLDVIILLRHFRRLQKGNLLLLVVVFGVVCCGPMNNRSSLTEQQRAASLKEAWDLENDPVLMDDAFLAEHRYTANFSQLALAGKLAETPWSDDYWPNYKGGISLRWQLSTAPRNERLAYPLIATSELLAADLSMLSPAEKYDLYQGDLNYPLTEAERERSGVLKTIPDSPYYEAGYKIPIWEGLCHAWAPATLFYKEPRPLTLKIPRGPLQGKDILFASSDIKALLTHFLDTKEANSQFLGMRCDVALKHLRRRRHDRRMSRAEYEEQKRACDDVNAGAFHIVLANQISRRQQGFIMDISRGVEVWNQPIYGFKAKVLAATDGASHGAAPDTVKELFMETSVQYIVEIDPAVSAGSKEGRETRIYRYRLELNSNGDIIGGAWPSHDSGRPDFLWKQDKPDFGEEFSDLAYIYDQSIKGG